MKNRKRCIEYFSFYNHTGIEAHFTEMARKGWLIESISNLYWTYRRIEPKNIHFCVTYYPRASDFDPGPSEDQQTFHDFCAHTGWKLACSWHQMQVFYNEKESPILLETDPIMEVDTLHRACKKNYLPSYYFLLALSILMGGYSLAGIYFVPIDFLSSSSRMITGLAYLCLFAISVVELITYFTWYSKAKKAAQDRIFMDTPSTTKFQYFIMLVLMIGVIWWFANLFTADDPLLLWIAVIMSVGLFGVIFLVNGIKQGLKIAKVSRGANRFFTLAACFILPTIMTVLIVYTGIVAIRNDWIPAKQDTPSLPLLVSDFYDVDDDDYIQQNSISQTFLLGHRNVHLYGNWDIDGGGELPDLKYSITTVKLPLLYDWCKDQMYRDMDESEDGDIPAGHRNVLKPEDAFEWDAVEVYRVYNEEGWWLNRYLICYEERIVDIRFDWEPTAEDMAIVSQKLNP